ncbi:MAG: hypothetical protein ACLP1W_14240 [Rhodomicrobium sp.]
MTGNGNLVGGHRRHSLKLAVPPASATGNNFSCPSFWLVPPGLRRKRKARLIHKSLFKQARQFASKKLYKERRGAKTRAQLRNLSSAGIDKTLEVWKRNIHFLYRAAFTMIVAVSFPRMSV